MPRVLVANGSSVAGDGSFLDIVASFTADNKAVVANHSIDGRGRALEQIGEGANVERGLLEVEVELRSGGVGIGLEAGKTFSLETFGDVTIELDLGIKDVCGGPSQGAGRS